MLEFVFLAFLSNAPISCVEKCPSNVKYSTKWFSYSQIRNFKIKKHSVDLEPYKVFNFLDTLY